MSEATGFRFCDPPKGFGSTVEPQRQDETAVTKKDRQGETAAPKKDRQDETAVLKKDLNAQEPETLHNKSNDKVTEESGNVPPVADTALPPARKIASYSLPDNLDVDNCEFFSYSSGAESDIVGTDSDMQNIREEMNQLEAENSKLNTEVATLTQQNAKLVVENESLTKKMADMTMLEKHAMDLMADYEKLTEKVNMLQNAFGLIDPGSYLKVRTVTIFDFPNTVSSLQEDLEFIMHEIIVIYTLNTLDREIEGNQQSLPTVRIKCVSKSSCNCIYYFLRWHPQYKALKIETLFDF